MLAQLLTFFQTGCVDVVSGPPWLLNEQVNHPDKLSQMGGHHTQYSLVSGRIQEHRKDQMAFCGIGTIQILHLGRRLFLVGHLDGLVIASTHF